jgi:serine/threonine-protein kinase
MMTERPRRLAALRDTVPPHVDTAVMTALAKLPADRFPSAAAFAAALVAPAAPAGVSDPRAGRHGAGSPRTAALLAAGALTVGAALGWVGASARERVSPTRAAGEWRVRFAIEPDSGALLRRTTPAIAPDGGTVVFAAEGADGTRLYARRVDDLTARPLAGTEGGEWPFFSPDGAWVGFYADGAVRKVRLDGGAVSVVAATPPLSVFYGGGWGDDDTILFVVGGRGGLYRVLAAGGRAATVPVADSTVHVLGARPLPGGRAALVTLFREGSSGHMGVLDFASGRIRPLGSGTSPRYVPGFLVYASFAGDLYRRAFDLERLAPTGPPEQIARDVQFVLDQPSFDVSPAGALVYRVGYPNVPMAGRMTLSDRAGRELQAFAARAPWTPRFSPDGQRVAYGANAPGQDLSDIWVTDLAVGTTQRVTTDGADNNDPHWGPDGRSLVYSAIRQGTNKDLVVQALDGGAARRLTARPFTEWPSGWSPDGSALLFTSVTPPLSYDIWVQPAEGGAPRPYLATAAQEYGGRVSPDGRWVAYTSNETGRFEVYVQSYPTPGRKTLVSASGGAHPVWRRDGRELYYWREDQLIAASLGPGGANAPLVVRGHMPLFRAPYVEAAHPNYDVSPDGTRFVVVTGRVRANRLVVALQTLGAGGARRAEGH